MDDPLSTLERLILFVADDDGLIPMPKGDKECMKTLRISLAHMKKRGFVTRQKNRGPGCLPYSLTASGKTLRHEILRGKFHE